MSTSTHDSGLAPFLPPNANFANNLQAFRSCPICGGTEAHVLQHLDNFQFFTDGAAPRVDLIDVQCAHCFACYKNPTYTDEGMHVLFAGAARSYGAANPPARAAEQVAFVKQHAPRATSVLDYGCGDGSFLRALGMPTRFGIELEPMLSAAIAANDRGTFAPSLSLLGELLPAQLDVITLWHTLEHVADPIGLLSSLRGAASATTQLFLEVPVLEQAATADLCGFFTPQHMTHFSRQSLLNTLARSGWEAMRLESQPYNSVRCVCRALPIGYRDVFRERGVIPCAADYEAATEVVAQHQRACRDVDVRLRASTDGKTFILWGAGMHTELLWHLTSLREHMPISLVDSDPDKQHRRWHGIGIFPPSTLDTFTGDWTRFRLVISSYSSQAAMIDLARAHGVPPSAIVTLYNEVVCY